MLIMEIIEHLVVLIGLVAVVTSGLIEVLKQTSAVNESYIPLTAIFMGLAVGMMAALITDFTIGELLWAGLLGGLASMGLFDTFKSVKE